MPEIITKTLSHQEFLDIENWNILNSRDFPFQSFEFLSALLNSESINQSTGQELFITTAFIDQKLVGAIPCYMKYHSYGEYLFDWQWANHFESHKIPYYPKLVAYSPFTPIIGPKFLINQDRDQIQDALLKEFTSFAIEKKCFSASFLFPTKEEALYLANQNIASTEKRVNYQYNWRNNNYLNFESFLNDLRKNKRKNIVKERESILNQGIAIREIPKDEIKVYATKFYPFYLSTVDKKFAHAYLTESFFEKLFQSMPENILLFEAKDHNRTVAMSLSLKNDLEIFGRYWGCLENYKNLHFEMCYYQNIDYAIKHNIQRVQAGAQGTHKIARGFLPEEVCSFHWFVHPQINQSIQKYIQEENKQMESIHLDLIKMSPFKN